MYTYASAFAFAPSPAPASAPPKPAMTPGSSEGLDLSLFAHEDQADNYMCTICYAVPAPGILTVHTKPCLKVFCKGCITQWLKNHNTCPCCGRNAAQADYKQIPIELKEKFAPYYALCLSCPHRDKGCKWSETIEKVEAHVKEACDFTMVPCRIGCKGYFERRILSNHETVDCDFRAAACPDCGFKSQHNKVKWHKDFECPKNPDPNIYCRFRSEGCTFFGKAKDMDLHYKTCAINHAEILEKNIKNIEKEYRNTLDRLKLMVKETGFCPKGHLLFQYYWRNVRKKFVCDKCKVEGDL